MLKFNYKKHELVFNFDARTSRGEIKKHNAYIIYVCDVLKNITGYGEASPLEGLSIEYSESFEEKLKNIINDLNNGISVDDIFLDDLPSLKFGIETALLDLKHGGKQIIFNNNFIHGEPILINGLVWMADKDKMLQQAFNKINDGFDCIKIKVGSLDFDDECRLLEKIRNQFSSSKIILRLDANGAFDNDDALLKLKELSRFEIHSIEQPIKPNNTELMNEICAKSKIPVALDEELIGVFGSTQKQKLLLQIIPQYIILKPTLVGGFKEADEWIMLAEKHNIGWWATSALESNIGLNAIAQWVFGKYNKLHQGLGTGSLYTNNFNSPLQVRNGKLSYNNAVNWELFEP
ncbi:MAG: o-succinylbenzoate synthase [Bacteroidia bacterium]